MDENGRRYFSYGLGAEFSLFSHWKGETTAPFAVLRITGAALDAEESERYTFEILSGKRSVKLGPEPLGRIEDLLESANAELRNKGIRKELPLLRAEVREFYEHGRMAREASLKEAEAALKRREEPTAAEQREGKRSKPSAYVQLSAMLDKLAARYAEALVNAPSAAETEELGKLYEEVRSAKLLEVAQRGQLGLFRRKACPYCGDRGLIGDEICACAAAREEEIKAYAATQRIVRILNRDWRRAILRKTRGRFRISRKNIKRSSGTDAVILRAFK